jgi:hypothetical protein
MLEHTAKLPVSLAKDPAAGNEGASQLSYTAYTKSCAMNIYFSGTKQQPKTKETEIDKLLGDRTFTPE